MSIQDGEGNEIDPKILTDDEKTAVESARQAFVDIGSAIQESGTDEQKEAWQSITSITFRATEYSDDAIGRPAVATNQVQDNAIAVYKDAEDLTRPIDFKHMATHEIFHSLPTERSVVLCEGGSLINEMSVDRKAMGFIKKHFDPNFVQRLGYF